MNKTELIAAVADASGETKASVGAVLDALEGAITDAVAGGDKVSLPGFLTFERGHRAARQGKNPQTGEPLTISAANVAKVKVGSKFKEKVAATT